MKKKKAISIISIVPYLYFGIASLIFAGLMVLFAELGFYSRYGLAYWTGVISIILFKRGFHYFNQILITEDLILVESSPLFAGKEYYKYKSALIDWNCIIRFSEIENVELVNLTQEERIEYYGTHTIWNQFLKIDVKGSDRPKFIYISIYTEKQMNRLLDIINSRKTPLEEENAED